MKIIKMPLLQLEYFQYSDYSVLLANDLIEGDSG
jgi:hypothetical protein